MTQLGECAPWTFTVHRIGTAVWLSPPLHDNYRRPILPVSSDVKHRTALYPLQIVHASGGDLLVGADADVIDTDSTGHLLQCFGVLVQVRQEVADVDRSVSFGVAESRGC